VQCKFKSVQVTSGTATHTRQQTAMLCSYSEEAFQLEKQT